MDCASTVEITRVLVLITQFTKVLLIMLVAISEDTVSVEPTRVLNCPSFILTFVPKRVETVSVLARPESVISELPCSVE